MAHLLDSFLQDLRYTLRSLRLAPVFAIVTVVSLALGIGANTAIFSLLNAVMLKTLPVHAPEELVLLDEGSWTNPIWEEIRDHQSAFDGVFAWANQRFDLATSGETRYVNGILASGSFFDVLGVKAIAGRTFTVEDDRRGCGPDGPVAVVSAGFAQREFGEPAAAVGKIVSIDNHPFNVIGVTAASFFGVDVGRRFDLAAPICSEAILRGAGTQLDQRSSWWLNIIGRLKPGSSLEQAQTSLRNLQPAVREATTPANWPEEYLKDYLREPFGLIPAGNGQSGLRIRYSQALYVLMAVVGLVLLVACANIANLLLARSTARSKEIAVRVSMGASRFRLLRQLLVEGIALALIGAVAGILVAQVAGRLLVAQLATTTNQPFLDLSLDWRVLGFTTAAGILTGVLFGVFPAFQATRRSPAETLREMSRSVVAAEGRVGAGRWLVAIQVGFSLVLLVGATLFMRSYNALSNLNPGFNASNVLLTNVDIRRAVSVPEQRLAFYERMLESLRAIPGVQKAALAVLTPISGSARNTAIQVDGYVASGRGDNAMFLNYVSPGYLDVMETPILAGRDFNAADTSMSPKVAIINESAARKFYGKRNPIGLTYRTREGDGPWMPVEIVGIARDAKYRSLREVVLPTAYLPFSQNTPAGLGATFVAKAATGAASLAPAITSAFRAISKDVPLTYRTFESQVQDSLGQDRLMATLSGLFGILALTVAAVGLAGLVSYSINRRRAEIGIRAALGATPGSLVWLVLRDISLLTLFGLILGFGVSLAAGRFVASMLYGLTPEDPYTLALAGVMLVAVAIVAALIPARRAAQIDPIECLRSE
jgi:putative ABC transport system permease protein